MLAIAFSFIVAAESADIDAVATEVPSNGEVGVPRNSALVLDQVEDLQAALVTVDEGTAPLEIDRSVEGVSIVRVPEQDAHSEVRVLVTQGGFERAISWTCGDQRIQEPARAPEIVVATVERPLLERPRVFIEVEPDPARAALIVFAVEGEERLHAMTALASFGSPPTSFGDFSYSGGAQEYELISVDRAGGVSEATSVVVGAEGGCASVASAGGLPGLALVLLARRRRR